MKSAVKAQKSASKNPNPSPRNKIRERKFVVAKRNSKREKSVSRERPLIHSTTGALDARQQGRRRLSDSFPVRHENRGPSPATMNEFPPISLSQCSSPSPSTTTNIARVSNYEKELEEMKNMTRQEFVASLRRKSSGFSRGASIYRGVTRHHQHGRWQARNR